MVKELCKCCKTNYVKPLFRGRPAEYCKNCVRYINGYSSRLLNKLRRRDRKIKKLKEKLKEGNKNV